MQISEILSTNMGKNLRKYSKPHSNAYLVSSFYSLQCMNILGKGSISPEEKLTAIIYELLYLFHTIWKILHNALGFFVYVWFWRVLSCLLVLVFCGLGFWSFGLLLLFGFFSCFVLVCKTQRGRKVAFMICPCTLLLHVMAQQKV